MDNYTKTIAKRLIADGYTRTEAIEIAKEKKRTLYQNFV